MPQGQEICCFWGGGDLNYLEMLSLKSFVSAGHPVSLYSYHPPQNTPDGVTVKSAADVMPQDVAHPSLVAELFRWRCLAARPGVIWAAPDFALLAPIQPDGGRLLVEQGGGYLSPDIVALPPDSDCLRAILGFTEETSPIPPWLSEEDQTALRALASPVGPEDLGTGVWGAAALSYFARETGEVEEAVPKSAFYPFSYADRALLLKRKVKLDSIAGASVAAIPLYAAETARQLHEAENGLPKYWCPLGSLLRQFEIAPRAAPLWPTE